MVANEGGTFGPNLTPRTSSLGVVKTPQERVSVILLELHFSIITPLKY
jgi:hypothetical protein